MRPSSVDNKAAQSIEGKSGRKDCVSSAYVDGTVTFSSSSSENPCSSSVYTSAATAVGSRSAATGGGGRKSVTKPGVVSTAAVGQRRDDAVTPATARRQQHKATFNLKPEYIPVHRLSTDLGSAGGDMYDSEDTCNEWGYSMTPAELAAVKEANQKRIKRIITVVGITLTVLSVVLVFISLSFGRKIDELVGQSMGAAGDLNPGDNSGFYLGATKPPPSS